jgi:glycosyltransferase involved in cell wall biosynthesis
MNTLQRKLLYKKIQEWALFDSPITKVAIAIIGYVSGVTLLSIGQNSRGTALLASIHRANLFSTVDCLIESKFKQALSNNTDRMSSGIREAIYSYPQNAPISKNITRFIEHPESILNGCALILKTPSENEKGVLYLFYSYLYPLLLRTFDARKITQKYRLVLEPSWSGFCDLSILCTSQLQQDIVVGYGEPRDASFLNSVCKNLIPGNFTGNTWIDVETFKPIQGTNKDIDVIVVASWAWYKRHWAIFEALKTLRKRGHKLKVALVGYPVDMTMSELQDLASSYGILDQIEFYERVSTQEVNQLLNRSKVNLLWSRREGTPRTIPEGMAAGVPAIIRKGFNYGAAYNHINDQTGIYSDEKSLPNDILRIIAEAEHFNPRPWIIKHMTPETSTQNLNDALKKIAANNNENFFKDAEIKLNTLHGLIYKNANNIHAFHSDKQFLLECIRGKSTAQ